MKERESVRMEKDKTDHLDLAPGFTNDKTHVRMLASY